MCHGNKYQRAHGAAGGVKKPGLPEIPRNTERHDNVFKQSGCLGAFPRIIGHLRSEVEDMIVATSSGSQVTKLFSTLVQSVEN